ncbi:MAG: divergent polysaccharide deacetylase family protein [Roseovarius sp.]
MIRGALAGMVTGLAVSGLVLGTVSVVSDLADMAAVRQTAPEASAVDLPPGSGFDAVREDREAALPTVTEGPTQVAVPRVAPPERDDLRPLSGADTAPVQAPDTGAAGALGTPPAEAQAEGGVAFESDSPILPAPQAVAPALPDGEARLVISTDPAQPPAPDPGEASAGLAAPVPEAGDPARGHEAETAPEVQMAITEPLVPPQDASDAPDTGTALAVPAEKTPEATDAVTAPITPDEGAPAPDAAPEPRLLAPSGTLENHAEGITVGRLPRIGGEPEEPPAEAETTETPPEEPEGALRRNAVAFEPPAGRPLMAIVLIDEGQGMLGLEALQAFPYPLSFAIPAGRPDAAEAAARYRAAGFEVLIAADLPESATAADTETAMQAWLAAIPQAVAVIEGTGTGLQASREASAQLAPILTETGHGIIMLPNGLNTAQKLIAREGVPSVTLFRDIDGQGQDAGAVRRFLDQGAMRAGQQEEGVIMLGRVRADTISALLLWGLQDRAASVALAPVSAVLSSR